MIGVPKDVWLCGLGRAAGPPWALRVFTVQCSQLSNGRRKWQPTPVLVPGKFRGWSNLVGYSPRCRKGSDMAERLHFLSLSLPFSVMENNTIIFTFLKGSFLRRYCQKFLHYL